MGGKVTRMIGKERVECIVHSAGKLGETPLWCDRTQKLWWLDIAKPKLQSLNVLPGKEQRRVRDGAKNSSAWSTQQNLIQPTELAVLSADEPALENVVYSAPDMALKHGAGAVHVALHGEFQQLTVIIGDRLATKAAGQKMIAKEAVEGGGKGVDQNCRSTRGDERLVKFPVIPHPFKGSLHVAVQKTALDGGQLVMGGDDMGLPVKIASGKRQADGVALKKQAKIAEVFQFRDRHRRNLETALTFRNNKIFCGKARQCFPQRGDADGVHVFQLIESQPLPRGKFAGNDIATDTPKRELTCRFETV